MTESGSFRRYRGDGTSPDGKPVSTAAERGRYIAAPDLVAAVNASLAVEQPLLVTGEAGTGKTMLAYSMAAELGLGEVEVFAVRSDHRGRDLLYEFDNLQRFYDAQVKDSRAENRAHYIRFGALGRAIRAGERKVVLIDEIDKAPRDFPNDLLDALDRMIIRVAETNEEFRTEVRPVVVITSNRESQLPDPFLRRCVFHHIEFPDREQLQKILTERLGHLEITETLLGRIIDQFVKVREVESLLKKPATSELLTWALVLHRAGVSQAELEKDLGDLPILGALLKTREDLQRVRAMRKA